MKRLMRVLASLFGLLLLLAIAGFAAVYLIFEEYGQDLPDYQQLAAYEPPTVTRVHAGDGRLLAEFAIENRVFVPIEAIPARVRDAFLSAEDQNFFKHQGVDFRAILRAAVTNVFNLIEGRRPVGASTITQQVAKNFLLTNELSIERKVKEAILAMRIEKAYEKRKILELYLNEIYLGQNSYGVTSAALNYFNKSLDELTLAEAAYLAALPKAPNNYHPVRKREAAISRRNWVIGRMLEDGRISVADAGAAMGEPLLVRARDATEIARADYFTEEVRRELASQFGEDKLYKGGLSVRTSLQPGLQELAERALRNGLIEYDRRHGWRGPVARIDLVGEWQAAFDEIVPPPGIAEWRLAIVTEVTKKDARIWLGDGEEGAIPMSELEWARPTLEEQRVGSAPNTPAEVLAPGDVVLVETVAPVEGGTDSTPGSFALRQIPDVDGAIVAMDPHTGRVLAMSGGWSQTESEFNRSIQAQRQPGSAFKPFVYLTALENGFTPNTIILDAPFVLDQGPDKPKWKPENYSEQFYGPTPMRVGIEKSRNLMTVRLAQTVGMEKVVATARRFGIFDDLDPLLSMALGAKETTLLRMVTGYSMLVNGGKRIMPTMIDRVQDRYGKTIYRHDERACQDCRAVEWQGQSMPELPDLREQVASAASAYQVVSMLEGVVQRGTGVRLREIGKPLAGKTGTTNDSFDAWFLGFTPDLAAGVYVGFDQPRTLGPKETGSSVAVPIFKEFMTGALAGRPATPFRIPPGIRLVRVDAETGEPAVSSGGKIILEAFKEGDPLRAGLRLMGDGGTADSSPGAGLEPRQGSVPVQSPGGIY